MAIAVETEAVAVEAMATAVEAEIAEEVVVAATAVEVEIAVAAVAMMVDEEDKSLLRKPFQLKRLFILSHPNVHYRILRLVAAVIVKFKIGEISAFPT
jgi:hypothetical protein